jgi:hypothetical protein
VSGTKCTVNYLEYLETNGSYEGIRDVRVSKVKGGGTHQTLIHLRYLKSPSQKIPVEKNKLTSIS